MGNLTRKRSSSKPVQPPADFRYSPSAQEVGRKKSGKRSTAALDSRSLAPFTGPFAKCGRITKTPGSPWPGSNIAPPVQAAARGGRAILENIAHDRLASGRIAHLDRNRRGAAMIALLRERVGGPCWARTSRVARPETALLARTTCADAYLPGRAMPGASLFSGFDVVRFLSRSGTPFATYRALFVAVT